MVGEEVKVLGRSIDEARNDECSTTGKWHRFNIQLPDDRKDTELLLS